MATDFAKLQTLIETFGTDITEYDYEKNAQEFSTKNAHKISTNM
jgi:hypothetical protein